VQQELLKGMSNPAFFDSMSGMADAAGDNGRPSHPLSCTAVGNLRNNRL
jgi:hypothetical protein